jgi:MFS family permease
VLFYGFAVTSSAIRDDTGWSEGLVSGAFALGLLIAGLGAPPVARGLARHDPRVVLTAGSLLGLLGMLGFAGAPTPIALYLAWIVIGAAMAITLYEPAMAVLVALDPARRAPFAATNARIQRQSTLARASAPLALGVAVTAFGWSIAWCGCLAAYALAAERYISRGRSRRD